MAHEISQLRIIHGNYSVDSDVRTVCLSQVAPSDSWIALTSDLHPRKKKREKSIERTSIMQFKVRSITSNFLLGFWFGFSVIYTDRWFWYDSSLTLLRLHQRREMWISIHNWYNRVRRSHFAKYCIASMTQACKFIQVTSRLYLSRWSII